MRKGPALNAERIKEERQYGKPSGSERRGEVSRIFVLPRKASRLARKGLGGLLSLLPSPFFLLAMRFLALTGKKKLRASSRPPRPYDAMMKRRFSERFIEDQRMFGFIPYGKVTAAYSGCGAIAVHNTLVSLDRKSDLCGLLGEMESDGILMRGRMGTDIRRVSGILADRGIPNTLSFSRAGVRRAMSSGRSIALVLNDRRDVFGGMHYIALEEKEDGLYAHNAVYGRVLGPFRDLEEAMRRENGEKIRVIAALDISRDI